MDKENSQKRNNRKTKTANKIDSPKLSKETKSKKKFNPLRLIPLVFLVLGLGLFVYLDGPSYISMDVLREQREFLQNWVSSQGILAPVIYGTLYAVVVAFSLPLGTLMTITGGFLFGIAVGLTAVVIGATIGSVILFLAFQYGFGKSLAAQSEGMVSKMVGGFQKNAFSYLLLLRFIPIFPFVVVNIVAAILGVSLRTYFFATLVGIVPGSLVYVMLGNGLGAIFDAGETPNLSIIFEPEIILPILGLASLVLIQIIYSRVQDKKKGES